MSKLKVGVFALQGAFAKHLAALQNLGVEGIEVRKPADLQQCAGVIIPGGESTAILKQMWFIEIVEALLNFSKDRPVFGTCAGLILMSREIIGSHSMRPFGILDVSVERNAFGRQVESFCASVDVSLGASKPVEYPAVFIRAPRIRGCGPKVRVLATYKGEPVLIQEGSHLGATFHPELTSNPLIHRYFVSILKNGRQ